MSGRQHSDNVETLFSFELLVESIRLDKESQVSDELAVGVRLLDFPTLLIYQPQKSSGGTNQQAHHGKDQQGEYAFNRGKSCFFKMNLNSLYAHLSNTPLYAMVLGVKEEIPKLVGTSLISMTNAMDRIRQDVTEHGVSTPSSHGERGAVGVCNLMGEKIGSVSLSYKLLSLGASLLPHITEMKAPESTSVHRGQQVQQSLEENLTETPDKSHVSNNIQNDEPSTENTFINEDKRGDAVCVAMQTEHKPRSQKPHPPKETENTIEEDLTLFCPPYLFYNNSAEEKSKHEGGGIRLLNLDSDVFAFEDTFSEEETSGNKSEGRSSPVVGQRVKHDVKTSRNQETSEVTSNILGAALRQLPLLNALLVELSQLNGQNPQQNLSIHPNLSWIYRPSSTEPSAGHGNTTQAAQTKLLRKARPGTAPHLKHVHSPRYCSTPVVRPASVKVKEALIESKSSSKSPQKKLVYGTTKTFNLRLKQMSHLKVKRHECMDLIQNETQSSGAKERKKSSTKITKPSKTKSALNLRSSLNENVETMMQTITMNSALQETIPLKQKTLPGEVHGQQDTDSLRSSEKPNLSEQDLKCIHMPRVDGDVCQSKDKKERHSESNQVQSRSECDRHREKIESSGSSRCSSPKSSFSDSSGEENVEADYADDFNSLEPSDAYSPDPASSPELSRAKTPKSPVRPDFFNSGFQKRGVLPVPVKAPRSPQRALRGTHIIRPPTHASALSFSSDDGDRDESASLQTMCSRKQTTENSRVERSSGADSFISSRGQRSGSTKNSGPVRGLSAESVSSFDPQEIEELEDELGSLDFKKEYQHISELVANKLPGYTM